ncbi:MAG: hypothetical protein JWO82_1820 [Akkermansiaceae bacterium]|nr:hypothetical protein [Akkermansiaceae bacterium]
MDALRTAPTDPYAPPQIHEERVTPQAARLVAAVREGQRFYVVPYVYSLVFMTSRKNMGEGVYTVTEGNWPTGEMVRAALVTGLFGWWGIPWGFIWSVPTLIRLWGGGRDLTPAMLKEAVGKDEAKRILATAAKPKKPQVIWAVRAIVLAALCFPAALVGLYLKFVV